MKNPKVGDVFRGRYVLSGLVGRGGMGTVWRAHDRSTSRDVAVKFMVSRLEGSPLARKRFEREGKAAASLPSRHVVKVHDHGVEGSTPFLVMELLEGEDLATRLRRTGRLPLPEAVRLVSEICRGLRRAHEIGLIHRDLKPANIFLAHDEGGGEVAKILDFGMVKTTASTFEQSVATESGAIVGSVHYASPEQAQGERDLDLRSDLWSVAAVAFRAITGKLPFPGEALGVVVLAICSRPLPKVTDVDPTLPPALDAFFERAFQRDREQRFQSAIDLADAFVAAVEGTPVDAPDAPQAPFSGMAGRPTHLDGFGDPAETSVSSLGAVTRVVDLEEEATRMLVVDEAAPTIEEESPFGAQEVTEEASQEVGEEASVQAPAAARFEEAGDPTRIDPTLRGDSPPAATAARVSAPSFPPATQEGADRRAHLRRVVLAVVGVAALFAVAALFFGSAGPSPALGPSHASASAPTLSATVPAPPVEPSAVPVPALSTDPSAAPSTGSSAPRRCYDRRGKPTACRPPQSPPR